MHDTATLHYPNKFSNVFSAKYQTTEFPKCLFLKLDQKTKSYEKQHLLSGCFQNSLYLAAS